MYNLLVGGAAGQGVDTAVNTLEALLKAAGVPYIIENVEGAPLQEPITLCGTMFGLTVGDAELRRHRLFETSFPVTAPTCRHGLKRETIGIYGGHVRNRRRREGSADRGVADFTPDDGRKAMETPWMTLAEMSQAIPPAYAKFLADAALAAGVIGSRQAA